ncbi:MFS transporter [Streptomyces sp. LaPpAH-108]|uniref:MFS transporter n=1 Tax=Streptomyces sp. LaPpAH-108 TaxID=1155714 RepID=UPI0022770859|nr:MFS transporter [Streptomyces sp. LaPpAH-108]
MAADRVHAGVAVSTPVAGRLGDLFGYRRVLVGGLVLLVVGSVVAGVATRLGSYPGVLTGRVLQGLSGGVFPCAFGLARQTVPAERLRGVVAALSTMFGVGGALGMVVAGPLADVAGVAGVFWLVALLGVLALGLAGVWGGVVASPRGGGRVDLGGAVLLAGTLVCLLLGISQGRAWGWSSPGIVLLFCGAVVLGAGFCLLERRHPEPLVSLRLLTGRALLSVNVATVVVSVGMFAAVLLVPLLAATGFGYSASRTGLLMLPMAVCMTVAGGLAGRVLRVVSARGLFQLGAVLAGAALAGFGVLHSRVLELLVWGGVLGVGYGFAFASLGELVVGAVGVSETGSATGVNTILRTVGGAVGSVLCVAILAGFSSDPGEGYGVAFLVSAVIALSAAGVTVRRRP